MINRASVQLWGIVGQSAGPPKWAGKNLYRDRDRRAGATDPILSTQRMPRGRDPVFIYTKNAARRRYEFHLHKEFLERNSELSRIYLKNISALRAPMCEEFRKKKHEKSMI